jgi:hypothetical protein
MSRWYRVDCDSSVEIRGQMVSDEPTVWPRSGEEAMSLFVLLNDSCR